MWGYAHKPQKTCILLKVHPRVCGVYTVVLVESVTRPGSSPRMRGILMKTIIKVALERFIPAYAGYTLSKPRNCVVFDLTGHWKFLALIQMLMKLNASDFHNIRSYFQYRQDDFALISNQFYLIRCTEDHL